MASLFKGLQEKHEEPPMAMLRSIVLEYVNLLDQMSADSGPQPTESENPELARQLLVAMQETIDLTSLLSGGRTLPSSMGDELMGIPLHLIVFGAIVGATPGVEVASNLCATAALTTAKAKSTIQTMSRLLKSLKGVGAKKPDLKENIGHGWVDLVEEYSDTEHIGVGNE